MNIHELAELELRIGRIGRRIDALLKFYHLRSRPGMGHDESTHGRRKSGSELVDKLADRWGSISAESFEGTILEIDRASWMLPNGRLIPGEAEDTHEDILDFAGIRSSMARFGGDTGSIRMRGANTFEFFRLPTNSQFVAIGEVVKNNGIKEIFVDAINPENSTNRFSTKLDTQIGLTGLHKLKQHLIQFFE